MASTLELRQVQKGKSGRIHLAVPGKSDAPVRTLCNKVFEPGEYREVDDEADCQLCRRRRGNKALVSSAFFEGEMGSQLLEMSLQQAKAGRAPRQTEKAAPGAASRAGQERGDAGGRRQQREGRDRGQSTGTRDRGQSTGTDDRRSPAGAGDRSRAARGKPQLSVVPEPEKPAQLGNLTLAGLRQVSDNVYRSPAGVVVRGRKRGKDWEVAEVVFDGPIQVKHDAGGRMHLKMGDIVAEMSAIGGAVRATYRWEG
jgi:hypothetical protein